MDILSIRDTTGPGLVCFFEDTPQEHDKNTINSFNFLEIMGIMIRTTTTSQDTLIQKHFLLKKDYFILFLDKRLPQINLSKTPKFILQCVSPVNRVTQSVQVILNPWMQAF